MSQELYRILSQAMTARWFITPDKAEALATVMALRLRSGSQATATDTPRMSVTGRVDGAQGQIAVMPIYGTILPRASAMQAESGAFSCSRFQSEFLEVARDQSVSAIVLDIDSPGGQVDLVPETYQIVRSARRSDRPIIAVANTLAASAAYYLACAADEIVVSPSGEVGSIGVVTMHDNVTKALADMGIERSVISAGPRKTELYPYGSLSDEAANHVAQGIEKSYAMFVEAVAESRNVSPEVVRADPEMAAAHMGGGRCYHAQNAVDLGMADRVASLADVLGELRNRGRPSNALRRARLTFS